MQVLNICRIRIELLVIIIILWLLNNYEHIKLCEFRDLLKSLFNYLESLSVSILKILGQFIFDWFAIWTPAKLFIRISEFTIAYVCLYKYYYFEF